ncbi:hypothetical protein BC937DRAFT_95616 [Endogone sp. FLAS-F59071]|nr:hypothetical protein BC937DRAFT_95616 [Endogone sp. FLAS-F59071]|eukprot:RUS20242.1 hypothetical protein BC937DRAFT_95616 [Endogone sp. FLAS-F59071]
MSVGAGNFGLFVVFELFMVLTLSFPYYSIFISLPIGGTPREISSTAVTLCSPASLITIGYGSQGPGYRVVRVANLRKIGLIAYLAGLVDIWRIR